MVNIAVAGGTGELAREVIDAILSSPNKHSILILTRSLPTSKTNPHNLPFEQVDYSDVQVLTHIFLANKIHTVLSFIQVLHDPENISQKNLVEACVKAGVGRFAPSEYGGITTPTSVLPGWQSKHLFSTYLTTLPSSQNLQSTLFHPSLLTNYLSPESSPFPTSQSSSPHSTPFQSHHITPLQTPFLNWKTHSALQIANHDPYITFTTAYDLARVVAYAIEYGGAWPEVGGIQGCRLRLSELVEIAERVTGKKFHVEKVTLDDLKQGKWTPTWQPGLSHPIVSSSQQDPETIQTILKQVMIGILLTSIEGGWDVSDKWNQIIEKENKNFKFTGVEEFLRGVLLTESSQV
ncbi:hypothetical protein QBC38DRAFT_537771 [Podospora fimiseda]|uniref:NmrA-like domain-containing protein n=1 Tax=Podospora fimiseda TaxID=252190 RepID=A0AAN7GV09_9PEZI|nr:hypothetical protein QBC38DRAFT_537771 [Podospora fimiseda]